MEERGGFLIKPVKEIGRGGFGYVEKIELFNYSDYKCGEYARKILIPQDEPYREEFEKRFEREIRYQAACKHNNIVPIYIHKLSGGTPWFVMDLAESDLHKDISSGYLSDSDKINVTRMIMNGLMYLHDKKYLHRDIKPFNVLRFSDGVYKISDFGLVKNADKEGESEILTKVAAAMGTAKYMAPEVQAAGIYSRQTDIYALGVLIEDMNITKATGITAIIDKCTHRKPASRYGDVGEILLDLNKIKVGE
ncbi:protein kinase domain-containing protein [Serratia liquefaciens]|uniref:protein kinase domain-containing protein n=1 Tax=Serratia liquefaciens TaxID=614 RepID=UPI0038109BD1